MGAIAEQAQRTAPDGGARFALAFDADVFVRSLCDAYPEFATSEPPLDPVSLYLSGPDFSRLNANALFDESWYRRAYPDVTQAIVDGRHPSGLHHYAAYGFEEGRYPNFALHARAELRPEPAAGPDPDGFDAAAYLRRSPEAAVFLRAFPFVDAFAYAATLGARLDPQTAASASDAPREPPLHQALHAEFDADFYFETYLAQEEDKENWVEPFRHYLERGMKKGYSPNARFSEAWYAAFYADVRQAIAEGEILCGFHHYVVTGRAEGREPRFDMAAALEAVIPGVTEPVLLERSRALSERLRPMPCKIVQGRARTLWVVLPRLNPDISFGGYRAAFELIAALRPWCESRGMRLSLLLLEEERANLDYFLWRTANARLRRAFAGLEVRARAGIGSWRSACTTASWPIRAGT